MFIQGLHSQPNSKTQKKAIGEKSKSIGKNPREKNYI